MGAIEGGTKSYDQFIQEMHNAGIKTTNIREGKEANFADYGNALSDDLKSRIMDSFNRKEDYEMQAQIAGVYADSGRSVLQKQEFIKACHGLGYKVKCESVKTNYIPDYKAGNFSNSVKKDGFINVYTISDGMGGEIVIADANGNAALESEELFMNQILGDINYEISATKGAGLTLYNGKSGGNSNAVSGINSENNIFGSKKENAEKVEQKDYNALVEKFLENGLSMENAIRKADIQLNVDNMSYSGGKKAKEKTDIEKTAKNTVEKETNNKDIFSEAINKTVETSNETDEVDTIENSATKITEELLKDMNFFTV